MAAIVFNKLERETGKPSLIEVSMNSAVADFMNRKRNDYRFPSAVLDPQMLWFYDRAGYVPPDPDPEGGGYRPSVGQLTP